MEDHTEIREMSISWMKIKNTGMLKIGIVKKGTRRFPKLNLGIHFFTLHHNLGKFCHKLGTNKSLNKILNTQMLKKNSDGDTFLAVAVKNTRSQEKTEDQTDIRMKESMQDTIDAMELITERFGEETLVSLLMPKYGDSLLHIAVKESFKDLVPYFLSLLPEPENILNQDGYNALHLAVYNNNPEMVKLILQSDTQNEEMPTSEKPTKTMKFDVNEAMAIGETALHLAAQFGYCDVLRELIDHGGDLSVRDKEDGHTPLHDCLQQVFFEGGADDAEKCHKFFTVWDKVVEKAIKWWCTKQSCSPFSEDPCKCFIRPVARVGSGDPVGVLRLYTMITLDEVCSIYC